MKLAALLIASTCWAQTPPVIDLLTAQTDGGDPRTVTGIIGGYALQSQPPDPRLPIKIRLESIEPVQTSPTLKKVQILITNIGSAPYSLPIGRDGNAALRPTNRGRREFWFSLWAASERYPALLGTFTYSALDLPGSSLIIQPGGSARVLFGFDLLQARGNWAIEGKDSLVVRVECEDRSYGDHPKEYIIRHPQPKALSENEMILPLK